MWDRREVHLERKLEEGGGHMTNFHKCFWFLDNFSSQISCESLLFTFFLQTWDPPPPAKIYLNALKKADILNEA